MQIFVTVPFIALVLKLNLYEPLEYGK